MLAAVAQYAVCQEPDAAPQAPKRLVPLDELKITRDMERGWLVLNNSGPANRGQQYRDLSKTLLLWGRRWKSGQAAVPKVCHDVLTLVFQDCDREDDTGYLARSFLRIATLYRIYPGGSRECLIRLLERHQNKGGFLGEQVRLDDLTEELKRG